MYLQVLWSRGVVEFNWHSLGSHRETVEIFRVTKNLYKLVYMVCNLKLRIFIYSQCDPVVRYEEGKCQSYPVCPHLYFYLEALPYLSLLPLPRLAQDPPSSTHRLDTRTLTLLPPKRTFVKELSGQSKFKSKLVMMVSFCVFHKWPVYIYFSGQSDNT